MAADSLSSIVQRVSDTHDCDVVLYFGDINFVGANDLCKSLLRKSRKNLLLVLATYGGDPDAAYRIARRIQRTYETHSEYKEPGDSRFFVFVPTVCKSAGTLLIIGADKLFISRDAEVGPIDIQLRKLDEVGERASGLLPSEALTSLTQRARLAFLQHFRSLRTDRELPFSTKLAAEVAGIVTVGLFKPIFEQIDPLRLAEMERFQRIGFEYGNRLAVGNLKANSLVKLLGEYPSHNFIIDSAEMKDIFNEVSDADECLQALSDRVEVLYQNFMSREQPVVLWLGPHAPDIPEPGDEKDGSVDEEGGQVPHGTSAGGTGPEDHRVPGPNGPEPEPGAAGKPAPEPGSDGSQGGLEGSLEGA